MDAIKQQLELAAKHLAECGNVVSPGHSAMRCILEALRLMELRATARTTAKPTDSYAYRICKVESDGQAAQPAPPATRQAIAMPTFSESDVIHSANPEPSMTATYDEDADWVAALDTCERIQEKCDEMPDRGWDFAESVREKTRDIAENIEKFQRVTDGQLAALENMSNGLDRWLDR